MRIAVLVATLLVPVATSGQVERADLPPILADSVEIRLARSAAPTAISDSATIYVLHRGGHVKAHEGTNGYTCLVNRDHPSSLYPGCYDVEASRTVLQAELLVQRLREQGVSWSEAKRQVDTAFATGRIPRPRRPALQYMMSKNQDIYASYAGPHVGHWHPHIMIYVPEQVTDVDMGIPAAIAGTVSLGNEWSLPELTVLTHMWSDGAPEQIVSGERAHDAPRRVAGP